MAKVKRLLNKRITASDSDRYTIRLLRQEWNTNESQYRLHMIDEEEYQNNLQVLDAKLKALEGKYGLEQD